MLAHSWAFLLAWRLEPEARALRFGEYEVPAGATPRDLVRLLQSGRTFVRRLTVPEGLTTAQVLELVQGAEALEGTVGQPGSQKPGEGTLLPETYSYGRGDSRAELVARMRKAMDDALAAAWAGRNPELPLAGPHDLLVLASVVEKETGIAAERPMVAAVFVNRLKRGMKLQSDPTTIYAVTKGAGPLARPLTRADLELADPYNTYTAPALPPGPIANPGRASLEAAARPAPVPFLYFVADGSGGHAFAETLADHNRNVAAWRAKKPAGQ